MKNKPSCATCRFWNRNGRNDEHMNWDSDANGGEGESVVTAHRRCLRILHGNAGMTKDEAAAARDLALVTDGSGYAAALRTLPTFGCVLWERMT
jgi:hypothetical protein